MTAALSKSWGLGRHTAAAGTAIVVPLPYAKGYKTKVTQFYYQVGTTAHTATFLRPLARTRIVTAVAAAGTTFILARDPGNYSANATLDGMPTPSVANNLVAASDYLLMRKPDGTFHVAIASGSVTTNADGSISFTATAAPTGGIAASAPVWFMGVTGDTNPRDNLAHIPFNIPAAGSGTQYITRGGDDGSSLVESLGMDEPMLLYIDNATAQGWLENIKGLHAAA